MTAPGSSRWLGVGAAALGIVALALFPLAIDNAYYIHLLETIMIYAILLFGLDIVVGYTGQVSLGHAGLFGIGAYTCGVLVSKLATPLVLTLIGAIGVTALFGAILALPALRVTGPYLAMVTLAFGTIIQILINEMDFLTAGPMGIKLLKPTVLGIKLDERQFFWLVALLMILSLVVVDRILRSHLGRAFEALRGSPVASDCMGVSVYRYKVYAFVISAGLAGLAGSLYAFSEQYISPNTYNFELTVLFLLAVIMGGRKTRTGALLGATIIVMLPKLLDDVEHLPLRLGVARRRRRDCWWPSSPSRRGKRTPRQMAIPVARHDRAGRGVVRAADDDRLAAVDLRRHHALRRLLPAGRHRRLRRGPRSTSSDRAAALLGEAAPGVDAVAVGGDAGGSGNILETSQSADAVRRPEGAQRCRPRRAARHHPRPDRPERLGQEHDDERAHRHLRADRRQHRVRRPLAGRAHLGRHRALGRRTHVPERAAVRRDDGAAERARRPAPHLPQQSRRRRSLDAALPARARGGRVARLQPARRSSASESLAAEEARNLPYGKQRLLEIARALALDPELLLLDEPAAGLTAPDIKELVGFIRKIREHGITVILIEHHMDVVMSMCDTVSVLDFGQKIAEGTPAEVQAEPEGGRSLSSGGDERPSRTPPERRMREHDRQPSSPATARCRCCTASRSRCRAARW